MLDPRLHASERLQLVTFAAVVSVYLALVAHYLTVVGPYIVDDAFIYFRYADNLASGHGLVYNPGERTEGYTALSWVVMLAAASWLDVPLVAFAQLAGVMCGVSVLWLTWRVARRVVGSGAISLLPSLFLATNRTFCVWSIEGLETHLFGALLMGTLLAWLIAEERPQHTGFPLLGTLAAAMTLTRPEGLAFSGLMGAFIGVRAVRQREPRMFASNALVFIGVVGAQLVFRFVYYGDLLPNTFYAKVVGVQTARGAAYLASLASANGFVLYAPLTLAGMLAFARPGTFEHPRRWTLLALTVYGVYVASIGGDYFEFRFFAPVLPIWAAWTVSGSVSLSGFVPRMQGALIAAMTSLWLVANARNIVDPPTGTITMTTPEAEVEYTRTFAEVGRWMARNIGYSELVAIRPAGAIAYLSRARCLDIIGLNDREIARDASLLALDNSPGHQRNVTRDYLVRRGTTYFVGHPHISGFPARPGKGHISIELSPGRFLILHRLAPDASLQDRIYFLADHAGSSEGWEPVDREPPDVEQ